MISLTSKTARNSSTERQALSLVGCEEVGKDDGKENAPKSTKSIPHTHSDHNQLYQP